MKAAREAANLTPKQVLELVDANAATLYRIENARVRPQRRTVNQLLDAYSTPPDERAKLLDLLKRSGEMGWLATFESELPELYLNLVSFEADARSVRTFEGSFVPGLLQTRAYALHTINEAGLPIPDPADVDNRVEVRMRRQSLLDQETPLQLWSIIDEAVLLRLVGGAGVMIEQLEHLIQMSKRPNVILQVVPFGAGAHAGMPGSFAVLDFPDAEDSELVYSDSMVGDIFLEAEPDIRRFSSIFDLLRAAALSPADTARMINERVKTLKKGTPT
jgi:transcriptional regulator with XRE-family HTH domain